MQRLTGWRATALLSFADALLAVEALPGPQLKRWLQQRRRWTPWAAVHQWQAEAGWKPRPEITLAQLMPGVQGPDKRPGWIEAATPNGYGVAWIASIGRWGTQNHKRMAFVGQIDSKADLQVHPIPLEPQEKAMGWQAKGDGWLLLSSRALPQGVWRSRIQRYTLTKKKLKRGEVVVQLDAPLPAWSLVGTATQMFIGLGMPPFQREFSQGSCRDKQQFTGTVLSLRHAVGDVVPRTTPVEGGINSD